MQNDSERSGMDYQWQKDMYKRITDELVLHTDLAHETHIEGDRLDRIAEWAMRDKSYKQAFQHMNDIVSDIVLKQAKHPKSE